MEPENNPPGVIITPLVNKRCATGENPYWNPDDRCIYWTDIPSGRLYRCDPATGAHETIYRGEPVGGFTLQADGSWLLFRVRDIVRMTPGGVVTPLLPFDDETAERFNDVWADPEGRVFAGTMGTTPESGGSGGLYRVDTDGTITRLRAGTQTANGMDFSPDRSRFYWTDSTAKRIYRYRYDRKTGALSDETLFYQASPEERTPDGLFVDTEGGVWSVHHRAGEIVRHDPGDGHVLQRIAMPVPRPTSLFFGGADGDRIFVTTAGGDGKNEPAGPGTPPDGTLYVVDGTGARGLPAFRSRVRL